MAKLMCIGRVSAEPEFRENANKEPYVRFTLAEKLGYGETARTQFYQVWAWDYLAKKLERRKVKKGSLIWVSGSLELVAHVGADGKTHGKQLKLKLDDWDFVPSMQRTEESGTPPAEPACPFRTVDGEREPLPE